MITQKEVIPLLIVACETYSLRWNEYFKDSYSDGEEQLLYLDLADFARHVIELFKENNTNSFDPIFKVVEDMHITGEQYVKEAITIGFLEALQNNAEHSGINPHEFEPYLGLETKKWWNQLNDFWSGKIKYVGETFEE